MNLVDALADGIGARTAGSAEAAQAAETVAAAFRELGLEPRFQEFELLAYEADEPFLEVEGERWEAGPCQYAAAWEGAGTVRRIGAGAAPVGDRKLATFAVVADDDVERARLLTSPFGRGATPFLGPHAHVTMPPAAFVSAADAERLEDGMRVRLRVGGRFVPGCRERNVIADLDGQASERVLVTAHYDSVWRGPGAIDNASGVEGVRRVGERLLGSMDRFSRDVSLVAFAAEEIKLTGSRWYVDEARVRGELDQIAGVVNLDCIARGERLNILASPPELLGRGVQAARSLGLLDRYELETGPATGGVDSHWFAEHGVPALTLLHFPYDEYHLPADTSELLDPRQLEDAVDLAVTLVESQLADPVSRS
jgi:Iap family predicted aminopeptidase